MDTNASYAKRHYESAVDFFEQGLYEKALQQIEKAIRRCPKNSEFISTKGVFLHRMNDTENAAEAYKSAIQADAAHVFSHYNLGLIYMQENRTADAIREWQAVLSVKPKDVESIFNIAVALASLNKRRESIPFYKRVLALEPNHVKSHLNLSVIYRDLKEFEQAKLHLSKLKSLDATYEEVVNRELSRCEKEQLLATLSEDNRRLSDEVSAVLDPTLLGALESLGTSKYSEALKTAEACMAEGRQRGRAEEQKRQEELRAKEMQTIIFNLRQTGMPKEQIQNVLKISKEEFDTLF